MTSIVHTTVDTSEEGAVHVPSFQTSSQWSISNIYKYNLKEINIYFSSYFDVYHTWFWFPSQVSMLSSVSSVSSPEYFTGLLWAKECALLPWRKLVFPGPRDPSHCAAGRWQGSDHLHQVEDACWGCLPTRMSCWLKSKTPVWFGGPWKSLKYMRNS